jgi:hypothetical protein
VSDEIVEFIKTQLDEDEAAVKTMGVERHGRWWASQRIDGSFDPEGTTVYFDVRRSDGLGYMHLGTPGMLSGPTAAHIARHDPAAVLADVAAKRAVIELYETAKTALEASAGTVLAGAAKLNLRAYGNAVRALAAAYANRPGFKPEWRLP